ncbi:DUF3240 domain-containing protein [Sphingomonas sp.]|uniref:DUF3240 domain-containing protein n=1 Tax=Sphingomonas sp. TaxID=28214 RepID=UPI002B626BBA|nr:DUF3240 domain-containing protein [Sphingomonas sp.]HWK35890.1 DUF3240 domain-containing protein [Sphingomonas sp.]
MSRVALTFYCSAHDGEAVAAAVRDRLHLPVHLSRQAVLGRDFGDAGTGERVAGTLTRMAVEVELPDDRVDDALAAATGARRRLPFRWRTVAIVDGGRVE